MIRILAAISIACAIVGTVTNGSDDRAAATGIHPNVGAAPARAKCPKSGDPIAIQSVKLSENPIQAGTQVSGTVVATCNVAAVTAQVGTYRIGVPKTSPGIFRTTVDVPNFVFPGHFDLIVTAIRTDGATVSMTLPIEVRL